MKYLIDLDGTLMDGKKANLDAPEFVRELARRNAQFRVMTNSIKSPKAISERLRGAGMEVGEGSILNPIAAISLHLAKLGIERAQVVGSAAERDQVRARHDESDPEAILLLDFEKDDVSYNELQRVFAHLQRGVPLVAASGSPWYFKDEIKYLDSGAFVRLLEAASGAEAKVLGKPSREYFAAGVASLGATPSEVTVIGDDWSTDAAGAIAAGCRALLVRSGKYLAGDEGKCPSARAIGSLMEALG